MTFRACMRLDLCFAKQTILRTRPHNHFVSLGSKTSRHRTRLAADCRANSNEILNDNVYFPLIFFGVIAAAHRAAQKISEFDFRKWIRFNGNVSMNRAKRRQRKLFRFCLSPPGALENCVTFSESSQGLSQLCQPRFRRIIVRLCVRVGGCEGVRCFYVHRSRRFRCFLRRCGTRE